MKYNVTILLACLCLAVAAQKKQLPICVIGATSQHWVSGAPGGRQGINYAVKVFIRTDKKVEFKNLWIGNDNLPLSVEFFNPDIPQKIHAGDSVLLTAVVVKNETNTETNAKRLPIDYKGAALFEATIDGKARYFVVKKFEQLPILKTQ